MNLQVRSCGLLLPISSLPGTPFAGALGEDARRFVDFLQASGQSWWQLLPVNPIDDCHSPYAGCSAFAGEPLYIDLQDLVDEKLLTAEEIESAWSPGASSGQPDAADYHRAFETRTPCWHKAFERFQRGQGGEKYRNAREQFVEKNRYWLDDYTLFIAFSKAFGTSLWSRWSQPFRRWYDSKESASLTFEEKAGRIGADYDFADHEFWNQVNQTRAEVEFQQLVFAVQWEELKNYAHRRGVYLLGDIPIYVGLGSADTWSHPELFQITPDGEMIRVAGVPADAFNPDGQRWDSPLYDWSKHEATGYDRWIKRIGHALDRFDALRLDHFIGFYNYYSFPSGFELPTSTKPITDKGVGAPPCDRPQSSTKPITDKYVGDLVPPDRRTYEDGWTAGPQEKFFDALFAVFAPNRFLAEDLGVMNPGVHQLRDHYHLPGMKVLQFTFDHTGRVNPIPDWEPNSVACTGTHDTPTLLDWLATLEQQGPYNWNPTNFAHVWHILLPYQREEEKVYIDFNSQPERYLPEYDYWRYSAVDSNKPLPPNEAEIIRPDILALHGAALRAVANSASHVALFPVQDILALGASARMNFPGKIENNWNWRVKSDALTAELAATIRTMTAEGGRIIQQKEKNENRIGWL